jgi:hypothetical protein
MRKRPGVGTLRHQAEMESLGAMNKSAQIVQKNTEALS